MTLQDTRLPVTALSGFIGAGIDWPRLKDRLDACLLPQHLASGPRALPDLPDPFPAWRRAEVK